jgi:hypothetical protein
MKTIFQLRAKGFSLTTGEPRAMFSKHVFSDKADAEGHKEEFRTKCENPDDLYSIEVSEITVQELILD